MALTDMLSRKFMEGIVKSAVTMTAASYTAKGIDQGIQKILGVFETAETTDEEQSDTPEAPLFDAPTFD